MTAPTLTEFLLARIAEDEASHPQYGFLLNVEHHETGCDLLAAHSDYGPTCDCEGPKRWLAECEAKRRAVKDFGPAMGDGNGYGAAAENALHYIAAIYADHPDFREEWRP